MIQPHTAQNSNRQLVFNGELLGHSSSRKPWANRWIEFFLYRTEGGTYVLHRIGVSMTYHGSTCELVARYGLHEAEILDIPVNMVPCELCNPASNSPFLYPEKDRHWSMTTNDPDAIIGALHMKDQSGYRYLTRVAQLLLEEACEVDADLDQAYRVEHVL